ncbi:DUF2572 family protein [Volucribacter amazonae]|uniref:DUF2572 family protein n=1 Tax=Volucribacter amazonae TaxID=256731 RepID=A0A9X4PE58_9PAST|nr:DUF2572 family protein [Volucribacter amazonae]MDG6895906.1 hypothetical protein [Volucribacter amazonae]
MSGKIAIVGDNFVGKGNVLLGLLMLFSATLFILLLYDDQWIRFHRQFIFQHQDQLIQHLYLQQNVQNSSKTECERLDLWLETDSHLLIFGTTALQPSLHQYRWCVREKLFKQIPRKNRFIGQFDHYVNQQKFSLFAPHFDHFDPKGTLYWFSQPHSHWQIQQDINAIIVAQGDLTITGKGHIRGSVITQGALQLEPQISLTYSKNVVEYITQKFSRWQVAEQSWYDFTPNE